MPADAPKIELVERGTTSPRTHALGAGAHRIGRLSACDVVLDHPSVSRIHARLEFDPDAQRARVRDADSENGIEVGGGRVIWADVRPGDRLSVGEVELEVRFDCDLERWPTPAREVAPRPRLSWSVRLGAMALGASTLFLAFAWWAGMQRLDPAPTPQGGARAAELEPVPGLRPAVSTAPGEAATATAAARFAVFEDGLRHPTSASPPAPPDEASEPVARPRRGARSAPPRAAVDARTADLLRRANPSDAARVSALELYVRGDLSAARSAAQQVRSGSASLVAAISELERWQGRVRTEVSNDPSRAHALLETLVEREAELLPQGVRSYVTRDLMGALVEAYARLGAARFDAQRYAAAYQAWSRGLELDPEHPRLATGMAQLLRRAAALAEEAELAGQRGDALACDRWRRVESMTPPASELHGRARRRSAAWCR